MKTRKEVSKDQYFTSPQAADAIVGWLASKGWFDGVQNIVEPCAGGKALVYAVLDKYPHINMHMYDLNPLSPDIIEMDSLKLPNKKTGLIGGLDPENTKIFSNPPFGYSNSLAKKFVKTFKQYDACWILTAGNSKGELGFLEDYEIVDTKVIDPTFFNYETNQYHTVDCLAYDFRKQVNTNLEEFLIALDWFDINIGKVIGNKYDKMLEKYRSRFV